MRYAYLQFDGIGNAANAHRKVGNLFDVKLKAIDNLHRAGVEIVPVVTIVNGINNEQVGRIIQFALDNPKKIDRKSTRLNSSHANISYAVFCLKKKKPNNPQYLNTSA